MPNPWDIGSARWLRGQGFQALATTSAGFAFTQGRADQDVPRDMMLAHIAEMVKAVPDLPINADFENGYADTPDGVAANVKLCVATGVAGLSIEDATGRADDPLYPFDLAVAAHQGGAARHRRDRLRRAAHRPRRMLPDRPSRPAGRKRRAASTPMREAGADVLYAPGPQDRDQIADDRRGCGWQAGQRPRLSAISA